MRMLTIGIFQFLLFGCAAFDAGSFESVMRGFSFSMTLRNKLCSTKYTFAVMFMLI